ncbi:MAG: ComEC/Rec2 family competence protein [Chryseobacterium taeanense]
MDFVIDFIYVGDGDAIIIWGRVPHEHDYVFFLDGGNKGNGSKMVAHYNQWIKPHLQNKHAIGFMNSHPHNDHINGLIEVVEQIGSEMSFAIYNDPVKCISTEHKEKIKKSHIEDGDPDIDHLYETFEQIEKLNSLCVKHGIRRYDAFNNINFFDGAFKILSPSKEYYTDKVQHFTDIDFLKKVDFSQKPAAVICDEDEDSIPCMIVDEVNDTSPENLTSTVLQLTDSDNRKYILTGDAGVESFDEIEKNGFDPNNIVLVQLPHHGSRRNVDTTWLRKFNPNMYIASAVGSVKHPRRAVINCIKKNLSNCSVYSTHTSKGTLSYTTNREVFPSRGWGSATAL